MECTLDFMLSIIEGFAAAGAGVAVCFASAPGVAAGGFV
jgi:hypothetical protein